jgi:hypothetical protein
MSTVVIDRRTKFKLPDEIIIDDRNPIGLVMARARAHDNSAGRKLKAALARKAVTEARLKALGMPLKAEKD